MIGTLSRRLRVRDDGSGKGREIDGTFAEFESEDIACITCRKPLRFIQAGTRFRIFQWRCGAFIGIVVFYGTQLSTFALQRSGRCVWLL